MSYEHPKWAAFNPGVFSGRIWPNISEPPAPPVVTLNVIGPRGGWHGSLDYTPEQAIAIADSLRAAAAAAKQAPERSNMMAQAHPVVIQ